jgi:hypothetical protein
VVPPSIAVRLPRGLLPGQRCMRCRDRRAIRKDSRVRRAQSAKAASRANSECMHHAGGAVGRKLALRSADGRVQRAARGVARLLGPRGEVVWRRSVPTWAGRSSQRPARG